MSPTPTYLTKKAALTFSSQLLANGASLISGILFTPLIVNGLGRELYGTWGMIQQSMGYLGLSNFNAMTTLKLTLAIRQHSQDISQKRRIIGSAIRQWLIFLPIMILMGLGMVYYVPALFKLSPLHETDIRWTLLIMAVSVPLGQLLALPAAVLRAQNLEYKAMGLNAFMVFLAGGLNVLGVMAGYGLVVLAVTTFLGMILVNGARVVIARKNIDWFGQERPTRQEFLSFFRLSGLAFLTVLSGMLFTSMDAILIGLLLGPETVTVYLMTGALVRFVSTPVQQLLSSGNAGIAHLIAAREWVRVEALRIEQHQTAFLILTVLGVTVILLNPAFISIWVGEKLYGGYWLSLAVVLLAFARQFVTMDRIPLDNVLRLGHTLILQLICGSMAIFLAYMLTPRWGAMAVPFCLTMGYAFVWVGLQVLIHRFTVISFRRYVQAMTGCVLCSVMFLLSAWFVLPLPIFHCGSWMALLFTGGITALVSGAAFFWLCLSSAVRCTLLDRGRSLLNP